MSTRSFYVPYAEHLERAEEHIAALMARQPPPAVDAARSEKERYDAYLASLRERLGPHPWAAWMALLGFVGWVGAAWRLASEGFDEEDRFQPRETLRWGLLVLVGLVMFLAGLRLA